MMGYESAFLISVRLI